MPLMRAVAWNVHFTIGEDEDPGAFAGIYQVLGTTKCYISKIWPLNDLSWL